MHAGQHDPQVPINPPKHPVPITPQNAVKMYQGQLSNYELSEVLDYPQIYYVGTGGQKIRNTSVNKPNHGYDDERGDYSMVMHDHIGYRYEVIGELGKGSFGQVVKVYDYKTQTVCALKIIRNKKRFHQQALIEVKLLEHLRDNDPEEQYNMVKTLDYFYFRNHLCITFECLSINLCAPPPTPHAHTPCLTNLSQRADRGGVCVCSQVRVH